MWTVKMQVTLLGWREKLMARKGELFCESVQSRFLSLPGLG